MNDRYLYKAKQKNWRELPKEEHWVYGYYVRGFNECEEPIDIMFEPTSVFSSNGKTDGWDEIDPTTLCACTGLKDKNDKLIWENDIVEFEDTGEEGYEYKEGFDFENRAKVEFAEARWSLTDFVSTNSSVVDEMYNHAEFMDFWQYCEVIGNIFDNLELMEV